MDSINIMCFVVIIYLLVRNWFTSEATQVSRLEWTLKALDVALPSFKLNFEATRVAECMLNAHGAICVQLLL